MKTSQKSKIMMMNKGLNIKKTEKELKEEELYEQIKKDREQVARQQKALSA
jgi:hypothetical protein